MKRVGYAVAAFFLGAVLCLLAFVLTGVGHGTYLPLALCASPTILMVLLSPGITLFIGLALAPLYWALLAFVATGHSRSRRWCAGTLLVAQYAGVPFLLVWAGERFREFLRVVSGLPAVAAAFFVLYAAAHLVLWRSAFRGNR